MTRESCLYGFLKVALDMLSEDDLYPGPGLATELLNRCAWTNTKRGSDHVSCLVTQVVRIHQRPGIA